MFPASHHHVCDVSDWLWWWRCYILLACSCLSLNYDDVQEWGEIEMWEGDEGEKKGEEGRKRRMDVAKDES